jgi:hypothetical protein
VKTVPPGWQPQAGPEAIIKEESMPGVSALAATGTDSFVIALQVGDGCATRLYRVVLSDRGRPGGLSPVGPELPGSVWSLAATTGGGVIGYAVSGCGKGDPGYIGVFDTRTQQRVQQQPVRADAAVTDVAGYRTSTGELQQDMATLRGASAQASCSMALDTSGQFLLVPYSLVPATRPMLRILF